MSRRSEEEDADAFPLTFWFKFTLEIDSARATKNGVASLPSEKAWLALVYLAIKPGEAASVAEVREACRLPTATTSRILAALEEAGYIARNSASDDGRRHELRLTKEGRNAIGKITHLGRRPLK